MSKPIRTTKHEDIRPIKNFAKLRMFLQGLKEHGRARRNGINYGMMYYTIFEVGMRCYLRISDVLRQPYLKFYKRDDSIRSSADIYDQKTGKPNKLNLKPLRSRLASYRQWREEQGITSRYMFPAPRNWNKPLLRQTYYSILKHVADYVGLNPKHIGSHSARKTGGYILYKSSGSVAMVEHRLNQSSERITMRYIDISNKEQTKADDDAWTRYDI